MVLVMLLVGLWLNSVQVRVTCTLALSTRILLFGVARRCVVERVPEWDARGRVVVVLEEVETQKDTMAKGAFSVVNMMLFACFAFALMSVYVMVNHEVSPATSGVRVLSAMLVA